MNRRGFRVLALAAALAVAGCGGGEKNEALVAKGRALVAEGKFDAAVVELKKATEADKNNLEAWMQLGHAYRGLKKPDDALSAYVVAKRIDRHSIVPHLAHAKVQIERGNVEQATVELTFVVEMDPKNLEALLQLGQVSQLPTKLPDGTTGVSKLNLERAELNLQAAVALAPKDAQVHFELVKVAAKLGKGDEARAVLAKLQALAENDAAAKKLLPEAEAALKTAGG